MPKVASFFDVPPASEDLGLELSPTELMVVVGGDGSQGAQRSTPKQELEEQFKTTFVAWRDFAAPVLRPLEETFKLVVAAERYLKYAYEGRGEGQEISPEEFERREAEKAQKQAEEEAEKEKEREDALKGEKEPTAAEVEQWIMQQPPPMPPLEIPSHLINPAQPQITIEAGPAWYPGGY